MRFDPEVARKLADGTLTMMQAVNGGLRATAIDASGRIAGHAVLSAPSHALTGALVVWQVLAVVTAQKFLADINVRLAGMERGISELKSWLEDEQCGKLDGSLRYMRTMAESLRQRDLTDADLGLFGEQLETIDREARSFMAMRERQLARVEEALPNIKLTGIGFEENSAAASRLVQEFHQACEPWWLAARVRGIGCQLRAPLPLSRQISRLRVRELREEMREQNSKRARFMELANSRLPELRGEFTFNETD
ncbi:MAG TPA: hypothetical protein VG963_09580, partial [Polyangiaceae bacterium]|nr:hypothetical protein [Polyangiaceae bacterium]